VRLPLLLQLGAAWALRSELRAESRPEKLIYFLHIPRTAGTSFIADAKASLKTKRSRVKFQHMEGCFDWREEFEREPQMAVMIRSPRHLVYSEYLLCAEGPISIMTQAPPPEKNGFKTWIYKWNEILRSGGGTGDFSQGVGLKPQLMVKMPVTYTNLTFKCYNPANLMSQRLSCKLPFKYPEKIDVDHAVRNMHKAWFVGITEAYQESLCLFNFKVYGTLPKYCNCLDQAAWDDFPHATTSYHDVRLKSAPLSEQEEEVVEMIDNMTVLDLKLYDAAVERFKREVHEVEAKLGVKLLCKTLPDPRAKMGVKSKAWPPPRQRLPPPSQEERQRMEQSMRLVAHASQRKTNPAVQALFED